MITKKLFKAVLAFTAFSLAACSTGGNTTPSATTEAGKDQLARIQEAGKIVVGLEGTWRPWSYHDDNGNLIGFDVEVAQNIAQRIGVEADIQEGAWDALFMGMDSGRYDIVVNGVDVTEDRSKTYDFTDPYAFIKTVLITRDDNTDINSFEDLAGKTTANSINSSYMIMAEEYGATVSGVETLDETLSMVINRQVDATLNASVSYYDYMNVHSDAPLKIAAETDDAILVAIPTIKGDDAATLREAINKALAEMHEDGTLKELSEKYFGTDVTANPNN